MRVPIVIQTQVADNGAATLCTVLAYHKRYISLEEARISCPTSREGTKPETIKAAAEAYGLTVTESTCSVDELKRMKLPVVVQWKRLNYTLVLRFRGGRVKVADPASGEYEITEEKFKAEFTGLVLSMEPGPTFEREGQPESLRAMLDHRLGGIRRDLVKLFVINLLAVGLNLIFVGGVRKLLAEGTFEGMPPLTLHLFVAGMSFVLLIYTILTMHKTLMISKLSRDQAATSGSGMFKHLFRLPMEFFDQISAGELMQRFENNSTLDRSLILNIVPRIIDVVMAGVYLATMFSYNLVVGAACLVVEAVYLVAMRMQRNAIAVRSRSFVTSSGSLNAASLNGMGTIETIKMSGTERVFFGKWKGTQEEYQRNANNTQATDAVTSIISSLHTVFSSAALLFVGAFAMIRGDFDVAGLTAMQLIVGRVSSSLSNCVNTLNSLQTMRTNIERVEDLNRRKAREEIALPEGAEPDKLSGELQVRDVCYRYNAGDPLAIDHVSFSVAPGDVIAIVGKSGCGKSTLLKLLADLYVPESGSIIYGDRTRSQIPDTVFRSSVVTVDQEAMMFEDTVRENLKMWDSTIEDYAMVLAARDAQIHNRIIKEKNGYDTPIMENGRGFSGGELQRLELARVLAKEPTILLLDEFTSALDALTEEKVMQAMRKAGTTCVMVAHRLSTIRDADQIYVLDKGRIVQHGTHDELMEAGGFYHDLVSTG